MSLPTDAHTALETFNGLTGWEQRARLLMQWGDRLPPMSDDDKDRRPIGCMAAKARSGWWAM